MKAELLILLSMTTATSDLRIFVAEDSDALRTRIVSVIGEIPNVRVGGQAASSHGAIDGILSSHAECALLDFSLEGGTALDVLRKVRPRQPNAMLFVITNYPEPQYRSMCEAAGADGFFDKSIDFDRVTDLLADLAARRVKGDESCPTA